MVTLIRVCERGTRCLHAREHRRVAILRQIGTIVTKAITINVRCLRPTRSLRRALISCRVRLRHVKVDEGADGLCHHALVKHKLGNTYSEQLHASEACRVFPL